MFDELPSPSPIRTTLMVEAVRWRGDNVSEIIAFGGFLRVAGDGRLELYHDDEFVTVPVGHWIVRYRGDHSEHWPMAHDRSRPSPPGPPEPGEVRRSVFGLGSRWLGQPDAG